MDHDAQSSTAAAAAATTTTATSPAAPADEQTLVAQEIEMRIETILEVIRHLCIIVEDFHEESQSLVF